MDIQKPYPNLANYSVLIIIWTLITLPFMALKGNFLNPEEGNLVLILFNKVIILGPSLFFAYLIIYIKEQKLEFYSFLTLLTLMSYISLNGVINTIVYSNNIYPIVDIIFLYSLLFYVVFLKEYDISKMLLFSITSILLFHSLDIILQKIS